MKEKIRYPWHRWLSRQNRLTLVHGKDFGCQPHSMAQQCRNAALQLGVQLSIRINGDTLTIINKGRKEER
jgi:hypothetical protein